MNQYPAPIEAEIINENTTEIKEKNLNPLEVIQLKNVVNDYNKLRQIVLDNVAQLKTISNNLTQEIEIEGFDPKLVEVYGKLVETSNKSLKILTDSYKSISDILINIAKINSLHKPETPEKEENNDEIISTHDILNKLRNLNN